MKIISFAQTTDALIKGLKSETRRCWTDDYARQFRIGDVCKAFDKNPRCGGKEIARIQILENPYRESIYEMDDDDVKAEGGLWKDAEEYVADFLEKGGCEKPYVVKFRLVSVGGVSCVPDSEMDELSMIGPLNVSKGQLKLFNEEMK
jgi:hypothetical protein